jgi:hypothetical protein
MEYYPFGGIGHEDTDATGGDNTVGGRSLIRGFPGAEVPVNDALVVPVSQLRHILAVALFHKGCLNLTIFTAQEGVSLKTVFSGSDVTSTVDSPSVDAGVSGSGWAWIDSSIWAIDFC